MKPGTGEIVFEVLQDQDGGFVAECLSESIITEADTWQELRANVREAVSADYFDGSPVERSRLHLVRDEIISVERRVDRGPYPSARPVAVQPGRPLRSASRAPPRVIGVTRVLQTIGEA